MQLRIDDTRSDKASLDVISEIDDSLLDEEKLPPSAMERERNDIVKVKKVCKCFVLIDSFDVVKINCIYCSSRPNYLSLGFSSQLNFKSPPMSKRHQSRKSFSHALAVA